MAKDARLLLAEIERDPHHPRQERATRTRAPQLSRDASPHSYREYPCALEWTKVPRAPSNKCYSLAHLARLRELLLSPVGIRKGRRHYTILLLLLLLPGSDSSPTRPPSRATRLGISPSCSH